ncbi:unnamed protein product [Phytomonas sp. Hart1]|nr:unnamed protein product [Phytomonas sp. Hart1]|eukprot:CCW67090.1 unnamed protein product [Phytomonas sp. isolate Hart1]
MNNKSSSSIVSDWESLKERGNQAFKNNLFKDAVEIYGRAIEAKADEPVLYSNRSAAFLKQLEFKKAAEDAKMAVNLDKTFVKAYSRLHSALCNLGDFRKATEEMANGIVEINANPSCAKTSEDLKLLKELHNSAEKAHTDFKRAEQLVASGDHEGASRIISDVLRQFPTCAPVAFLSAECTVSRDPEGTSRVLVLLADQYSDDPYYLYLRALMLYYRGDSSFAVAQELLKQALGLDPDNNKFSVLLRNIRNIEKHKEEGNKFFRQKRSREAIEEYTVAIQTDATNTRVNAIIRGNRAAARMDVNDFQGALLDCDYAIKNGVESAKLYARRSRVQEHLDMFDDSLRDMQCAANKDRNFEAELQQLKGRIKQAKRKNYYKILDLSPNESDNSTIKRAYKKACLQWHPDKWAHASETEKDHAEKKFKDIGEAFGVLSDPAKKRLYDSGQMDNDVDGAYQTSASFAPGNEEIINLMNVMFGGARMSGFSNGGFQKATYGRGGRRQGYTRGGYTYS